MYSDTFRLVSHSNIGKMIYKYKVLITSSFLLGSLGSLGASPFDIPEGQTRTSTQILNGSGDRMDISSGGQLETTGADGIVSTGTDANIKNSGSITTSGSNAVAISASGPDAVITNKGSISTSGTSAYSIFTSGLRTSIYNYGNITTTGASATGIEAIGPNALIINNGLISSSSYGISTSGTGAEITNNGQILTSEINAHGIFSGGSSSIVKNSGNIRTTGLGANAIELLGNNSTVSNSGTLSATGNFAYAILGGSGKQTLNILRGSRIDGRIDLDGGGDEVNFHGSAGSTVLIFDNAVSLNSHVSSARLIGNNKIVFVDPTNYAANPRNLDTFTSSAHALLGQRMGRESSLTFTSAGSDKRQKDDTGQPVAWAEVFGSRSESNSQELFEDYQHKLSGITVGKETSDAYGLSGLTLGVAKSDTAGNNNSQRTESLFGGIYVQHFLASPNLSGSLLVGSEENSQIRAVMNNTTGSQNATARFRSVFISPSITLSGVSGELDGFLIKPSVTANYTISRVRGYVESGESGYNMEVGSRTISALSLRLQVIGTKKLDKGAISLLGGAKVRRTTSQDIRARLNNSDFNFTVSGDNAAYGLFSGIRATLNLSDRLTLRLTAETGKLSGGESYRNGNVHAQLSF